MARIKIELPQIFPFTTTIAVRITDLNYGGHVGNDTVLSIIHEARMQFLRNIGYTELNVEGVSLIMSDASIEFKNELFYGDIIKASVAAGDFSRAAFSLYYKLEKTGVNTNSLVTVAKTGMVCYNYELKKISLLPEQARLKMSEGQ